MKQLRWRKIYSFNKKTFLATFLIAYLFVGMTLSMAANSNIISDEIDGSTTISPLAYLSDRISRYDTFNQMDSPFDYDTYFQEPPIGSYYHLVWLYLPDTSHNFDLYLYLDSGYSNQVGSSTSTTQWDWIVYRISSAKVMYPRVYWVSGVGDQDGYIEYMKGWDMLVGSGYNYEINLDPSGYVFEFYEVELSSSNTYTFTLEVPAGSDFDLFILRTTAESSTPLDVQTSATHVEGADETIIFSPDTSTWYAVIMLWRSGDPGMGILNAISQGGGGGGEIPGFEIIPILIGFGIVILFSLIFHKNRKIIQ